MSEATSAKDPETIRFHYIKSPTFHTIHVDGGIGGMTPNGKFHLALYAERFAIPTTTTHKVKDGAPAEEVDRNVRDGVVRELLVDLMFDNRTAESIRDWLNRNIKARTDLIAEIGARSEAPKGEPGKDK
jgi:hypothetical protein